MFLARRFGRGWSVILWPLVLGLATTPARANLFVTGAVSNDVLEYNGATGAFVAPFVPDAGVPVGMVFGPSGNVFVDTFGFSGHVTEYDGQTGAVITAFVPAGSGGLSFPGGLVFAPNGDLLVVSEATNQVLEYDGTTGAFIKAFASPGTPQLVGLNSLVFGPNGNLFVSTLFTDQVLEFDGTTGAFVKDFVTLGGGNQPEGLVFGPNGDLFISSISTTGQVLEYNGTTGAFVKAFVPSGSGGLELPTALVFGPNGNLFVGSTNGLAGLGPDDGRVLEYDGTTGAFLTPFVSAGSGGLSAPVALAFSPDLSTAAPEPSSVILASVAGLVVFGYRKRLFGRI